MVNNYVKVVALLLLVLPAILASTCKVTVTTNNSGSNTYHATATNTGNSAVSNIVLTPSHAPKSLNGLTASGNAYTISSLAAGASVSFTYTVKSGSVQWTSTCSAGAATAKPTQAHASTKAPTAAPTQAHASTKAPSTKAPTKTTTAPTSGKTTSSPTTAKAGTVKPSAGGRICPSGSWWAPSPLTTWQWQLTGTIDTSLNVQMYDIDMFDATTTIINTLHSQGKAVICYFSTQYENWRPDASSFTSAVIGKGLDGWAGENYVDIRSTVVRNIMEARLDLALSKGCDGVEPDNVDGYDNNPGFPITAADQIDFNSFLATQAHARGLSVGLKNDVAQGKTLEPHFDWALNEQCYEYSECSTLSSFITAGKPVFNAEYSGSGSTVCPYMNGIKFSSLIKTLDLTASIKAQCCTYQSPSCAPAAYSCVTSTSRRDVRSVEEADTANEFTAQVQQEFTASASTTFASVFLVAVALIALNF